MENHKVFWGVPRQSRLISDYLVSSEVEVLDGYGRLQVGDTVTIDSQPEDGASCGTQLYTGVPQFIVAYTAGGRNTVSTCNCEPPSSYLIEYLKQGKDTYLPNLNDCWGDNGEVKSNQKCKIWRNALDDNTTEHKELMRMHKILRELRTTKLK